MRLRKTTGNILLALLLTSCAGTIPKSDKVDLTNNLRIEDGLSRLQKNVIDRPQDKEALADYLREKDRVINYLLSNGDRLRDQGNDAEATNYYYRVLALDSENSRAKEGLAKVERMKRHIELMLQAQESFDQGDIEGANVKLQKILIENPNDAEALNLKQKIDEKQALYEQMLTPSLKLKFKQPVTLQFRDANLKMVFEALSRTSGINVLLDRDLKSDIKTTIFVKDSSVEDTIDLILMQNQLNKKILNDNTIFVYSNTPNKVKEYQDLVIRTFNLTNADAKQMQTLIKTMLKTKDIFVHEKTNSLVMRDTPEAIQLAEKLIAAQDMNEPEVMLEVEVLEVSHSRLTQLGMRWPSQVGLSITETPSSTNSTTTSGGAVVTTNTPSRPLTVQGLKHLNASAINVTSLNMYLDLRKELGDGNLLASPRIRVKQHEKAKVMIGDRVPVITNSVTPVSTGTPVVTGNVQYLDVGLKLEVEPDIHLDGEVAIKTYLEVSSIANQVTNASSGTVAYQIGTRNATTVLRLKDGETQVLAGLINDEDRKSSSRVPGLGDLPLIGRLFSSHSDDKRKTEIILSITPHIVRNMKNPDLNIAEFWSGTDGTIKSKPLSIQSVGTIKTNAATTSAIPNQAIVNSPTTTPVVQPALNKPASQVSVPAESSPALPKVNNSDNSVNAQHTQNSQPTSIPVASANGSSAGVMPVPRATVSQPTRMVAANVPAKQATPPTTSMSIASNTPMVVSLQGASQAKVGDLVKVSVNVQLGGNQISTIPLNLIYDASQLEAVDVAQGDLLKANGSQIEFNSNIDSASGQIALNIANANVINTSAQGAVAVVTFRALVPSDQTSISVSGSAINTTGDNVTVNMPSAYHMTIAK